MAKFTGRTQKRSKRPGRILTRVGLERTPLDFRALLRVSKTVAEEYWWLSAEVERRVGAFAEFLLRADRIDAVARRSNFSHPRPEPGSVHPAWSFVSISSFVRRANSSTSATSPPYS